MELDADSLERLVPERLSPEDLAGQETLRLHVERYAFAAEHALPGRLLDLACGVGYGTRILVVIAFAGFGVLTIEVPYWTWFSFPDRWFVGQALDQLIGAALAGVVVARHARPRGAD